MPAIITEYPCFFTASIWKHQFLLAENKYKDIVLNCLRFLTENKRVRLFAFVIMSNHIHLIWQLMPGHKQSDVQRDLLKYTAYHFQQSLKAHNQGFLKHFKTEKADRNYQFWQRKALSIELRSNKVFDQKLNYIHLNPVKAGLCCTPEQYYYSSARAYRTGVDSFDFLTHSNDE